MKEAGGTAGPGLDEQRAQSDFWSVYTEHFDAIRHVSFQKLGALPELSAALLASEEGQAHYDRLLRGWASPRTNEGSGEEAALVACHAFFAGAGVSIGTWCEVCALVEGQVTPLLIAAFASEPGRLANALSVLHRNVARTTSALAQSAANIQERRLAAARLETEQALTRFARLSESGVLGVLVCDFFGNIVEANDGFLQTFGYTREELVSGQVRWAGMTPPEWQHLDDVAIEQLRASGKTRPWEKEYFHKDGRRIPVLLGVATLNETQTIAFVLDISERKRLEEVRARSLELETQNRRIQEATRLKSEFLANMSHELRTPLNSIIGFAELLHDRDVEPDSPQYIEFLGDILKSGRHLLQLINDVLDLAKVEAGKIEIRLEDVDVQRLLGEVSAVLRTVVAEKQIRLETEVAPEVNRATLDPGRFKQVLYNYLSNALKFTPDGGNVRVRVLPEAPDMLRISVEDSGIGIAAADLGRLFIEFQQLEAGATKKHGGTGLGLALTKRLVEAQGGSVGVKSVVGHGSEFFATLPLHATWADPPLDPIPESHPFRAGAAVVLVVEDEPRDRALLMQTLTRAGYGVEAATSGAQAIAACGQRVFDAITLDLLLPDMTGLDVLHRVRTEGQNQQTPVIVVSVVAEQGIMAGFSVQDYLTKPVSGRALLDALEQAAVPPDKGGTLLIVDDDPAARRLMSATLKELGYQIHCSSGGEEALAFAARARPRAVILDLMMPGIDGFEFLLRFRESPQQRAIPVIVWTMKDLTLDDHRKLRQLAQGIVAKDNWTPRSFLEEIRGLVGQGSLGTACEAL